MCEFKSRRSHHIPYYSYVKALKFSLTALSLRYISKTFDTILTLNYTPMKIYPIQVSSRFIIFAILPKIGFRVKIKLAFRNTYVFRRLHSLCEFVDTLTRPLASPTRKACGGPSRSGRGGLKTGGGGWGQGQNPQI